MCFRRCLSKAQALRDPRAGPDPERQRQRTRRIRPRTIRTPRQNPQCRLLLFARRYRGYSSHAEPLRNHGKTDSQPQSFGQPAIDMGSIGRGVATDLFEPDGRGNGADRTCRRVAEKRASGGVPGTMARALASWLARAMAHWPAGPVQRRLIRCWVRLSGRGSG